jgi:hypothetical protein
LRPPVPHQRATESEPHTTRTEVLTDGIQHHRERIRGLDWLRARSIFATPRFATKRYVLLRFDSLTPVHLRCYPAAPRRQLNPAPLVIYSSGPVATSPTPLACSFSVLPRSKTAGRSDRIVRSRCAASPRPRPDRPIIFSATNDRRENAERALSAARQPRPAERRMKPEFPGPLGPASGATKRKPAFVR